MGNKRSQAISKEVRSELNVRIGRYRLLLHDYQTPLFHNQLLDAIKLHEEAVQAPDPTPAERERWLDQLRVLDNMNDRLNEHWDELHKNMEFRSTLLANIAMYQRTLGARILLDYTGRCSTTCTWASKVVGHIDNVDSGGVGKVDDDYKLYQQTFVRPLKEMMLDRDHVERRLRVAAAQSIPPAGKIYQLIDQCDWESLAYSVINDRKLAVALFGARQLNNGAWSLQFGRAAVQQIDNIRDKYFTVLLTPEKYTISKRARRLSAKKAARASQDSSRTPPLSPASSPHAEEASALAAAKSVYDKVVGGLGLGRTGLSLRSIVHRGTSTTSSGASLNSTTELIDEKKKVW